MRLGFLALVMVGALAVFLSIKFVSEFQNSRERGRFVVSMVREHLMTVGRLADPKPVLAANADWNEPRQDERLQSWLILSAIKNQDPEVTSRELDALSQKRNLSPKMKASLPRWNEGLTRWSRSRSKLLATATPDELLKEGRERYHEATGYARIGHSYDATVLYLWSSEFLVRFIETAPLRSEVSEALYLLGDSYVRFRDALPARIRSDRLLNLCVELFPGSIWADRASSLWQGEMRNGA